MTFKSAAKKERKVLSTLALDSVCSAWSRIIHIQVILEYEICGCTLKPSKVP